MNGLILLLVYIHKVQHESLTFGFIPDVSYDKWKELGIYFFTTYVDAALHAASVMSIISPMGLRRVCEAAVDHFGMDPLVLVVVISLRL